MNKPYIVIAKTGQAELRALENLSEETKVSIWPMIELTKGRKLPEHSEEEREANRSNKKELYPSDKLLERVHEIFKGKSIILDLTTDEKLSNQLIDSLYTPENGYANWISFLEEERKNFKEITPCIILNVEDENFEENLAKQVESLAQHFDQIIYRNSIIDENYEEDLKIIIPHLGNSQLLFMIDCGYITPASYKQFEAKINARIRILQGVLPAKTKFIISATSFPKTISEIGNDHTDTFALTELRIYDEIRKEFPNTNFIYSDYGSVNPVRNDEVIMARGWIPRIDVPLKGEIFYYRLRRPKGTHKYFDTYKRVANETVQDPRFPRNLNQIWGIQEIRRCSDGNPSSTAPNFWISVRMNIHIEQQTKRLNDK